MRIGIKIDSAETPELRALLAHMSVWVADVKVGLNGPEKWTAQTEPLRCTPLSAAEFLRGLADRIEKNALEAGAVQPLIKDADPELERLLAEEEEVQRDLRDNLSDRLEGGR